MELFILVFGVWDMLANDYVCVQRWTSRMLRLAELLSLVERVAYETMRYGSVSSIASVGFVHTVVSLFKYITSIYVL